MCLFQGDRKNFNIKGLTQHCLTIKETFFPNLALSETALLLS